VTPRRLLIWVLACGFLPAFVAHAGGADWPQWRGPARNGVTNEPSGYPEGWPLKKLWQKNVGPGCSSPIVAKGRVYVMGYRGKVSRRKNEHGTDVLHCLDARTGRELWKQSYASPCWRTGDTGEYGGPSATPAFDTGTGLLCTLGIDGDLRCWNTRAKGALVWAKNLYDEYKVRRRPDAGEGVRDYGFTSSPLLFGKAVVVEVGQDAGTVMAFDKRTGKRLWRSAFAGAAGHTSGPVTLTIDGTPCLATLTLHKLVVMRADGEDAGKTVAEFDWQTDYACNIATPAVTGNRIIVTSAYNHNQSALLEVSLSGARRKWTSRAFGTASSPVVFKDRMYVVDRALQCADMATGKVLWRGGSFGHGSVIACAGDGRLMVFGNRRLAVVEAGGDEYRELSRVDRVVADVCYPHPALADGLIFCKDRAGNLACLSVTRKAGEDE